MIIEPDYTPVGNVKWMWDRLQEQIKEKEEYIKKLEHLEDRYITLTKNFTLHMDICRSHSKDWQGRSNDISRDE